MDSVGEGEGGMIWENSADTYTVPHVQEMTGASLVYEARHPKPVLWDSLEDGGGEGGGKGVEDVDDMCVPLANS